MDLNCTLISNFDQNIIKKSFYYKYMFPKFSTKLAYFKLSLRLPWISRLEINHKIGYFYYVKGLWTKLVQLTKHVANNCSRKLTLHWSYLSVIHRLWKRTLKDKFKTRSDARPKGFPLKFFMQILFDLRSKKKHHHNDFLFWNFY